MILRLQSLFAGLMALLTAALLALGAAQAKPASGGYQDFEPVALEHQQHIQLSSLGNFDYYAKTASECCNAPNRTLPDGYRDLSSVGAAGNATGGLPNGYRRAVSPSGDIEIIGPNGGIYRSTNRVDVNGNPLYPNGGRHYSLEGGNRQYVSSGGTFTTDPIWTSTSRFDSVGNARDHWSRHGSEFPEYTSSAQYVQGAQSFLRNPPTGTLTKTRPNGDVLRYNPSTNTFGVMTADGTPRTMFRPSAGLNYWNRQ